MPLGGLCSETDFTTPAFEGSKWDSVPSPAFVTQTSVRPCRDACRPATHRNRGRDRMRARVDLGNRAVGAVGHPDRIGTHCHCGRIDADADAP